LHNEELRDLYSSPSIISRKAYRLLVGNPEGTRPLRTPKRSWSDNVRMDLGEVGWRDVDWIGLAENGNI
jgi:hypothetical protein